MRSAGRNCSPRPRVRRCQPLEQPAVGAEGGRHERRRSHAPVVCDRAGRGPAGSTAASAGWCSARRWPTFGRPGWSTPVRPPRSSWPTRFALRLSTRGWRRGHRLQRDRERSRRVCSRFLHGQRPALHPLPRLPLGTERRAVSREPPRRSAFRPARCPEPARWPPLEAARSLERTHRPDRGPRRSARRWRASRSPGRGRGPLGVPGRGAP